MTAEQTDLQFYLPIASLPVSIPVQEKPSKTLFLERINSLRAQLELYKKDQRYAYEAVILERWLETPFAPTGAQEIYTTFLITHDRQIMGYHPGYPDWWEEKAKDIQLGRIMEDGLEQKIIERVIELGLASNREQAIKKLDKTLAIFEGIVNEVDQNDSYEDEEEPGYPPTVILSDHRIQTRFKKQLVFYGILTLTQLDLLSTSEKNIIANTKLPLELHWLGLDLLCSSYKKYLPSLYQDYPLPKNLNSLRTV